MSLRRQIILNKVSFHNTHVSTHEQQQQNRLSTWVRRCYIKMMQLDPTSTQPVCNPERDIALKQKWFHTDFKPTFISVLGFLNHQASQIKMI